jgi:hypothetical protein
VYREKAVGASFSQILEFATCGALLETTRLQALTVTRAGAFAQFGWYRGYSVPFCKVHFFYFYEWSE